MTCNIEHTGKLAELILDDEDRVAIMEYAVENGYAIFEEINNYAYYGDSDRCDDWPCGVPLTMAIGMSVTKACPEPREIIYKDHLENVSWHYFQTSYFYWFIISFLYSGEPEFTVPQEFTEEWLYHAIYNSCDLEIIQTLAQKITDIPYLLLNKLPAIISVYSTGGYQSENNRKRLIWFLEYIQPFMWYVVDLDKILNDLPQGNEPYKKHYRNIIKSFILSSRLYRPPLMDRYYDSQTLVKRYMSSTCSQRELSQIDSEIDKIQKRMDKIKKNYDRESSTHDILTIKKLRRTTDDTVRRCLDDIRIFSTWANTVKSSREEMRSAIHEYEIEEQKFNAQPALDAEYNELMTPLREKLSTLKSNKQQARMKYDFSPYYTTIDYQNIKITNLISIKSETYATTKPKLSITFEMIEEYDRQRSIESSSRNFYFDYEHELEMRRLEAQHEDRRWEERKTRGW